MMKKLLLLGLLISQPIWGVVDLEEEIPDFVLQTKRLSVPGYPTAFNPSVIRWEGRLLMSFRTIPDRKESFNSEIGVVWLDDKLNAISPPKLLDLRPAGVDPAIPSRAEDAFLIESGGDLYLVYDDNRDREVTKGGFRMYIAKLKIDGDQVVPDNVEGIFDYEGASPTVREKSWVPFSFQGELLLAYSLFPHRIFRYLPGTESCETFCETSLNANEWAWGPLRGGTAALRIEEGYLAFFHSCTKMTTIHSDGKSLLHYFIGAYIFSSEPPFEILRMSTKPIVGKNFYNGEIYKPYWHPIRAVFPRGYLLEGETIRLFYGRQDHEIWVVTIDKKGLLDSLTSCSSEELR